jgi:hypothetical protein
LFERQGKNKKKIKIKNKIKNNKENNKQIKNKIKIKMNFLLIKTCKYRFCEIWQISCNCFRWCMEDQVCILRLPPFQTHPFPSSFCTAAFFSGPWGWQVFCTTRSTKDHWAGAHPAFSVSVGQLCTDFALSLLFSRL